MNRRLESAHGRPAHRALTTTSFLLAAAISFLCPSAEAQRIGPVHRIGYLAVGSVSSGYTAFVQALKDLGYVEGSNIALEARWAEGKEDRLSFLAKEILGFNPSVVVVGGSAAAFAVLSLSKTVPIVIPDSADPVGTGLIKSLERPGGNVTGLTIFGPQLAIKRLELLKEAFPRTTRVAVVTRAPDPEKVPYIMETQMAASQLGLQAEVVATTRKAGEVEDVFPILVKKRFDAFILIPSPIFTFHRQRLTELAARNRLPAMYPNRRFVDAGGLMSYAGNIDDLFRRAASFVDKILKGANPGDLPMEAPTTFEFVINLIAAKKLGVTIAPEIILEANEVIR